MPYYFTDLPAADGQVVSRVTNKPVAGALVTLKAGDTSKHANTDEKGSFSLPAVGHLGLLPIPTEGVLPFPADTALQVEAAGYHPIEETRVEFPFLSRDTSKRFGTVEYGRSDKKDTLRVRVTLDPTLSIQVVK